MIRFLKFMNINFTCNLTFIIRDVPHQIWEAQSADGGIPVLLSRFLHNKPTFFADNFLRCYLSYLSPEFINAAFTFLGLILFLIGLWYVVTKKKKLLLALILVAPLFPLFELPKVMLWQGIIIYTVEALIIIYGVIRLFKRR